MILHLNDKQNLEVEVNDSSYRYRAIKRVGELNLYFSLPEHIEVPLGAWCEFQGETYTLEAPENFKKHGTRNFEYTLVMELAEAKLRKYKYRDIASGQLKFSLTGKPSEHLRLLVDNLNQREKGWEVGDCVDSVEKVLSYNHAYCRDALSQMADAFETEWEVEGKKIHLRKVEHFKDNPLPMSYGRGNGFLPGLGRTNFDSSKSVEVLFVQGGERNIDPSKYGSRELLLPKNQTLTYEGRRYVSDKDGLSIRRADKALQSYEEDSLDCSHIYPSRVGTVEKVKVVDAENNFYDFTDPTIPAGLDYAKYTIEGENLRVIFQSGMLVGREFDVRYVHSAQSGKAARRFEIVPQEVDGQTMPNATFTPDTGDAYAVFGMNLPDEYVCDNATQSGASWDMFREAAKYLYEHEEPKFSFTGEMDGIWAKKDWLNIGGRIKVGGYLLFSDAQFQPEGVPIRIVGVKDYINNPYKPQIEISNSPVGGTVASVLKKIAVNEVVTEEYHRDALQFTKRRFRDAKETMSMLEGAMLNNFSQSVSPITVQTMAMLLGDESLQFCFVDSKASGREISHNVVYNATTKVLTSPAGTLKHMTLGIESVSPSHAASEYRHWTLPELNTPPLAEADKKYYLYARVSKTAGVGEFCISETAIGMEAVAGYYHLLLGVLNSEYDGERSYASMYGYTEILPGQLTAKTFKSPDGKTYMDLVKGEIGGNFKFYAKDDGSEQELAASILGIGQDIQGAQSTADAALSCAQDAQSFIDTTLPAELQALQAQIDGQVESFFYDYNPTMSSYPASTWTTDADREKHLNDTFTNNKSGASWRFSKSGSTYHWVEITDTATTKALALAGQAKDTADGKRRVFVVTPTTPYDVGDLWTQGSGGDLMRCVVARQGGSYVAGDWERASKYTDDTEAKRGNIYVRGTGLNHNASALVYANGEKVVETGARGLWLCVFDMSLTCVYSAGYDTYGYESQCDEVAAKIDAYASAGDYLFTLVSYDACSLNDKLRTTLAKHGGASSGTFIQERRPFAFIGKSGIGVGNGFESLQSTAATAPYAELSTRLQQGALLGGNAASARESASLKYLTEAIKDGDTQVAGGLSLGNLMFVKDTANKIRGGMSGMSEDPVAFFAHSEDAYNVAVNYLNGQSSKKPNFAVSKTGDLLANKGFIGDAEIIGGDLSMKSSTNNSVVCVFTKKRTSEINFNAHQQAGSVAAGSGVNYTWFNTDTQYLRYGWVQKTYNRSETLFTGIIPVGLYQVAHSGMYFRGEKSSNKNVVDNQGVTWVYSTELGSRGALVFRSVATGAIIASVLVYELSLPGSLSSGPATIYNKSSQVHISEPARMTFESSANFLFGLLPGSSTVTDFGSNQAAIGYVYSGVAGGGATSINVSIAAISKVAAFCPDGIVLVNNANSKAIISNEGNQLSVRFDLPTEDKAQVGEMCRKAVSGIGNVVIVR